MIKISIYEDNEQLRKTLCSVIMSQPEFQLIGEYGNCLKVVENSTLHTPDVILMDIDMPYMTGLEGVKLVKPQFPSIEIIMITVFDDAEKIFEAIKSGATGYLLKNTDFPDIVAGIKDVVNGGAPMNPSIARKVLNYHSGKKINAELEKLSQREIEIVTELSKGLSYKMIAQKLFVSVETVRTHIKKIYQKLHVHNATEAVNKVFLKDQ